MNSLDGLHVIELSTEIAGPFSTRLLADAGARVTKVEGPEGDACRRIGPYVAGTQMGVLFSVLNRGKRSICIDLAKGDGRAVFRRLLESADVVVESHALAFDEAAGDDLRYIRTSIVDEPSRAGVEDLLAFASSGFASVNGRPGRSPLKGSGWQAGFACGAAACVATLAAVHKWHETGKTSCVTVPLLDPLLCTLAPSILATQLSGEPPHQQPDRFPSAPLTTRDGPLMLTVSRPHFWTEAMSELGLVELASADAFYRLRPERFASAADDIQKHARQRGMNELFDALANRRVTVGKVMTTRDLATDPHLLERGFASVDGSDGWAAPFKMSKTPLKPVVGVGPRLGEHTKSILAEIGFAPRQIEELLSAKVVCEEAA